MIIQICVGSSCHLKGSEKVVDLFRSAIAEHKLDGDVTLVGCFCTGQCNQNGVAVLVDDVPYGVTPENFDSFFKENVLNALK